MKYIACIPVVPNLSTSTTHLVLHVCCVVTLLAGITYQDTTSELHWAGNLLRMDHRSIQLKTTPPETRSSFECFHGHFWGPQRPTEWIAGSVQYESGLWRHLVSHSNQQHTWACTPSSGIDPIQSKTVPGVGRRTQIVTYCTWAWGPPVGCNIHLRNLVVCQIVNVL